MDLSIYKSIAIPQGNVKQIGVGSSVIWRKPYQDLDYVFIDGNVGGIEIPYIITNQDTVRFKFETVTAGDMFGYHKTPLGPSFYLISSNSSTVFYGTQKQRDGWVLGNTSGVHDAVFSQSGYTDNGITIGTFHSETFTLDGNMILGRINVIRETRSSFNCYRFAIDGKCDLRPMRRTSDSVVGLYDIINDVFYTDSCISYP